MRIHFIGICGVSMRGLAKLLKARGHEISGSDATQQGHIASNVENADLVVYTNAVKDDNVELVRAAELGIMTIERAECLAKISAYYKKCIAVAGSHGKTTASAMLLKVLQSLSPTAHIGGNVVSRSIDDATDSVLNIGYNTATTTDSVLNIGYNTAEKSRLDDRFFENNIGNSADLAAGGTAIGGDDIFITEACEYNRSFLRLTPSVAIVLNIDLDHTDCYKDLFSLTKAFSKFTERATDVVIVNGDSAPCSALLSKNRLITYGLRSRYDYSASALSVDSRGRYSFCAYKYGRAFATFSLSVPGIHNVSNALAVIACADHLGLSVEEIRKGLLEYKGVERRFEYLGESQGALVYSDYAHHPSEIECSIKTARQAGAKNLTVIFEPHTYSRTRSFLDGFAKALCGADNIIILPIFASREQNDQTISSLDLYRAIKKLGHKAIYFIAYSEVIDYLKATSRPNDTLIFMGAGDIDKAARLMLAKTNS